MSYNESYPDEPDDDTSQYTDYSEYITDSEIYIPDPIFLEEASPFTEKIFAYDTKTEAFHESITHYIEADNFQTAYLTALVAKKELLTAAKAVFEEIIDIEDDYHILLSVLVNFFIEDLNMRDGHLEVLFDKQHASIMTDREEMANLLRPVIFEHFKPSLPHERDKIGMSEKLIALYKQLLDSDLQNDKIMLFDYDN